jgi:hypothetical protein
MHNKKAHIIQDIGTAVAVPVNYLLSAVYWLQLCVE